MGITRRAFAAASLAGVAGLGSGLAGFMSKPGPPSEPVDIAVDVAIIAHFLSAKPQVTRFGPLEFEGGLRMTSSYSGFGGFSGLAISPDGQGLTALTDAAQWLQATLVMDGTRPVGLAGARMAAILGPDGRALRDTKRVDTESLAFSGNRAFVGIEGTNEILRFDAGHDLVRARGTLAPVPPAMRHFPRGRGLGAIGIVPTGPLAGSVIGLAERSDAIDAPTAGVFITGPARGEDFGLQLKDAFAVTDMAFLDQGDMLLLERRFVFPSIAMRIRRVAAADIKPGALLDGPVLLTADMDHEIDNMEGIALHRGSDGATRITLISDDNFSPLQQNILLRFRYAS